jgi:hypothetical protein
MPRRFLELAMPADPSLANVCAGRVRPWDALCLTSNISRHA